jgi:hypothetical protein
MKTLEDSTESRSSTHLWAEALWGVGLIGSVLTIVLVLVTVFGR